MKRLVILGAGGYGRTVADTARQMGRYDEILFLDDRQTGPEIGGTCEMFLQFLGSGTECYPAFGNNEVRLAWLDRLEAAGACIPTLIHPRAYVSPQASLGKGTVVLPMAAVNAGVKAGRGCIFNLGALIDHDCVMEDGVHLCPGVIVKAENRIPCGRKIESGEVILARTLPL